MFNVSIICFCIAGFLMLCATINQLVIMKKIMKSPNPDTFFNRFAITAFFGISSVISFVIGVVTLIVYLVK